MKTYTIKKFDPATGWDGIPTLNIDELLWTDKCDISACGQIAYSDEALLVHLWAKEKFIRAEGKELLDAPCKDSCLEFFFCPVEGDRRYLNIEFNPNCCVYLGMGSGVPDLVRFVPETPVKKQFGPRAVRTADGWEIFYSVPFSFIRCFFPAFKAESGRSIRANCFKCGDLTVSPHYLSWNRVDSPTPQFHLSEYFGTMIFE